MVHHSLEGRIAAHLADIERQGLRRRLELPVGIDLTSNDYLGLATHPLIKRRMAASVMWVGCGSTGSRLLRGQRRVFTKTERRFAEWKGTEGALFFGSGYLANLGVLTTFLEEGDVVFSDELNHASLIDGIRLSKARCVIYPHGDVETLRKMIEHEERGGFGGQKFLVTESLFSMDGDEAPLRELAELGRDTGTAIIVDEAHAVGIFGTRGTGLIEEFEVGGDVFLSINTASKALGVCGGFACGPAWAIEYMVQRARPFLFSTAPPPGVAAAIDAALDVMCEEPERRVDVLRKARRMRLELERAGVPVRKGVSQIVPVVIGGARETVEVAARICAAGFDVRAIRPPTVPHGTARLRLSVNLNFKERLMDTFVAVVRDAIEATKRGR